MFGSSLKLCYIDKDSFIEHVKTRDPYADLAKNVQKCSSISKCQ